MEDTVRKQVTEIIGQLDRWIEDASTLSLGCAADLFSMARLDLQMHLNAVSEDELHGLCDVLENGHAPQRAELLFYQ